MDGESEGGLAKGVDKPSERVKLHQQLVVVGLLILEEYLSNWNRSVTLLLPVVAVVVECDVELKDCDILKVNLFSL